MFKRDCGQDQDWQSLGMNSLCRDLCDRDGDGVVDRDDSAPDDPVVGPSSDEEPAEWE
jgi:hypothetical protein